jgi:hypothetical protein
MKPALPPIRKPVPQHDFCQNYQFATHRFADLHEPVGRDLVDIEDHPAMSGELLRFEWRQSSPDRKIGLGKRRMPP